MNYGWEPRWLLENIEHFHFKNPTTRFQWWYFDVLLEDGSLLIVALVPKGWWPSIYAPDEEHSIVFASLRSPDGVIKKWTFSRPGEKLTRLKTGLLLGENFGLEKRGGEYYVSIKVDGLSLEMRVHASETPFAASPFGRMPHWLLRVLSLKHPPISYVSLVPRDQAHVRIETPDGILEKSGIAYHEQGRFDSVARDLPRDGWTWFHIFGKDWSIFGAEDAYINIRGENVLIQHGYPMHTEIFSISEKKYWQKDRRVLQKAKLDFKTSQIRLSVVFEPTDEENLIHYSALDVVQLWSTRFCNAKATIEFTGKIFNFVAPALLETCRSR